MVWRYFDLIQVINTKQVLSYNAAAVRFIDDQNSIVMCTKIEYLFWDDISLHRVDTLDGNNAAFFISACSQKFFQMCHVVVLKDFFVYTADI